MWKTDVGQVVVQSKKMNVSRRTSRDDDVQDTDTDEAG